MSTASVRPACGIRSLAGAVALALLVSTPLLAQPAGANRIDTISPLLFLTEIR